MTRTAASHLPTPARLQFRIDTGLQQQHEDEQRRGEKYRQVEQAGQRSPFDGGLDRGFAHGVELPSDRFALRIIHAPPGEFRGEHVRRVFAQVALLLQEQQLRCLERCIVTLQRCGIDVHRRHPTLVCDAMGAQTATARPTVADCPEPRIHARPDASLHSSNSNAAVPRVNHSFRIAGKSVSCA
jgi:hypothetical protein